MRIYPLLAIALLAVASACGDATGPTTDEESVQDSYIITVADSANPVTVAHDYGITPHFVYTDAIHGFAAYIPDATRALLLQDTRVESVEADEVDVEDVTQAGATWGLDRVDQRQLPLNGSYGYTSTGAGVTVYIIDTGILFTHGEFGTRATLGFDGISPSTKGVDCQGHGTHVAGTVGGTTYGIAKSVKLVAVRVLSCSGSGSNSGVIAGVDWVTKNHVANSIANMSLGGGASSALDAAVAASIKSGVTYVTAAGNDNKDACGYSPARAADGITVGATDATDTRSTFSNFGGCVDLFAPGTGITSVWIGSNTATKTISGTSMAAPHVAGVAALYLSANPGATPAQVASAILGNATSGVVKNPGNVSPNRLLFSNY